MSKRKPPSKSKHKPLTWAMQRLHTLINEARLACDHPNSQPAVTHLMMSNVKYLREIEGNKHIRRLLLGGGLGDAVRMLLKRTSDDDDDRLHGATEEQIALWPAHKQAVVRDIDRARVYVPSLEEFTPLEPDAISNEQIVESGSYLIKKGEDCIRVGNALIRLGGMK